MIEDTPEDHVYSFTKISTFGTNVKLNDDDTSENLKISPNGLEVNIGQIKITWFVCNSN